MESKAKRTHKFSKEGRGRYFLIAALFASLASMLILADSFRVYESKVTAILIAKSDRAATLSRSMVENTVLLADTMAYQNRFFEAISSKNGAFDETPDALRRASFRKMISVSAGEEGSVLSIRGIAEDPDDSKERARQASLTLFQFFGQYYNIKDDVEFRIIEGPVTSSVIGNKWGFFGASLALGVLSTGVLFLALFSLPSLMGRMRKEEVFHKPFLDAKVFEPERPLSSPYFDQEKDRAEDVSSIDELFSEEEGVALQTISAESEPSVRAEAEAVPEDALPERIASERGAVSTGKKAGAPLNLPAFSEAEAQFLEEFSFEKGTGQEELFLEEEETDSSSENGEKNNAPSPRPSAPRGEPTEEEYKRRLNELMRG